MDVADPRPQHIGSHIVEPEGRGDQQGIEGNHGGSGETVFAAAPGPLDVQGHERTQQHQHHHGGTAVQHEQVSGDLLPHFAVRPGLELIGDEPAGAGDEQRQERSIDRETKPRTKPQGRMLLASWL